jgi:hypothetical protein
MNIPFFAYVAKAVELFEEYVLSGLHLCWMEGS